jgi:hypothetical protein
VSVFETAARDLFADPNVSRAATYTPPSGDPVDCRVMPEFGENPTFRDGLPVTSTKGRVWRVLASVVTPEEGGVFTIVADGSAHKIKGTPQLSGSNRLAWSCATREVEA